jgi:hypothetical protein
LDKYISRKNIMAVGGFGSATLKQAPKRGTRSSAGKQVAAAVNDSTAVLQGPGTRTRAVPLVVTTAAVVTPVGGNRAAGVAGRGLVNSTVETVGTVGPGGGGAALVAAAGGRPPRGAVVGTAAEGRETDADEEVDHNMGDGNEDGTEAGGGEEEQEEEVEDDDRVDNMDSSAGGVSQQEGSRADVSMVVAAGRPAASNLMKQRKMDAELFTKQCKGWKQQIGSKMGSDFFKFRQFISCHADECYGTGWQQMVCNESQVPRDRWEDFWSEAGGGGVSFARTVLGRRRLNVTGFMKEKFLGKM